ncbi:MAG: NAD(P)-binding protein [Planctomycetota bacterium]|jgi:heterodisulfide reductase subunit A
MKQKTALIIGAGITGATVAQRLGQAGLNVHLIEKQGRIGGHAIEMGCKATDKCLRCNICVANETFRQVAGSESIQIHTRTQLTKLSNGTNGSHYTAVLTHEPTFITADKCIGCQICINICPEKCISRPLLTDAATPVIDYVRCHRAAGKECLKCEQSCPTKAIKMTQDKSESKIDVDDVIIATGYEPYDPSIDVSYGYGNGANVITGIEAERQLAENTKLTRPSDGRQLEKIAFVQCVGSRTEHVHRQPQDAEYCSAVCCAYALRMAKQMKHLSSDVKVTIFYMDIQNFTKGFDDFYRQCRNEMTFIRSRPSDIKQNQDGTVTVRFAPQSLPDNTESQICQQDFDLVVLAVGIRPRPDKDKLAENLLIPLDEHGFFGVKGVSPLPQTQRKGIFVAGACEWPKDIQGCIAQAEAVSAAVINEAKE